MNERDHYADVDKVEPNALTPTLYLKTSGRWERFGYARGIYDYGGALYPTRVDMGGHFNVDVSDLITRRLMAHGVVTAELFRIRDRIWQSVRVNSVAVDGARPFKLTCGRSTYVGRAQPWRYVHGPRSLELKFLDVRFLVDGARVWRERFDQTDWITGVRRSGALSFPILYGSPTSIQPQHVSKNVVVQNAVIQNVP